eukprot:8685436-Pyramimonas_sp.AAC.1
MSFTEYVRHSGQRRVVHALTAPLVQHPKIPRHRCKDVHVHPRLFAVIGCFWEIHGEGRLSNLLGCCSASGMLSKASSSARTA